jgi:hypothetical protein
VRICIVGCGNQGLGLAGLLAAEDDVERVLLLDSDGGRAEAALDVLAVANMQGFDRFESGVVDAADAEALAWAAAGYDLVFNAALPFLNLPIMRACLKAGAHYIDLYSLSHAMEGVPDEETLESQLELDGEFKAAGLAAFPCLGVSPGWTTLAAKFLCGQLDEVDSVVVRNIDWIDSDDLLAPAPPPIMLGLWLGPPGPHYLEGGVPRPTDLFESEELYEFPAPVGAQKIYAQAFLSDGVLIGEYAGKPIRRIDERGAVLSGGLGLKDIWLKALHAQTSTGGSGDVLTALGAAFRETTEVDLQAALEDGSIRDGAFASAVEVNGVRGGQPASITLSCVSTLEAGMRWLPWAPPGVFGTSGGIPIEVLLMVCRGEFTERGVIPATSLPDPVELFRRMGVRGHRITEVRRTAF